MYKVKLLDLPDNIDYIKYKLKLSTGKAYI